MEKQQLFLHEKTMCFQLNRTSELTTDREGRPQGQVSPLTPDIHALGDNSLRDVGWGLMPLLRGLGFA